MIRQPTQPAAADHEGIALAVRDLSVRFDERLILDRVSFDVRAGQVVGIMGMSGCGKSTLLRCLLGLLPPTAGQIWVQGVPIVGLHERELNRVRLRMGMCFQYPALFDSLTVAENVAFGLRRHTELDEEQIAEVVAQRLDVVGLAGTEEVMPSALSGGMAKRVSIARALALDPALILYDEPVSGLDPIMAQVISELVLHLRDSLGMTSVVVEHHVPTLFAIADTVIMLHDGRIQAAGTPEELRAGDNEVVQQFIHGYATGPIVV